MGKLGAERRTILADGHELCVRTASTRDARPLVRLLDAVAAEAEATLLMAPGQFTAGVWRRRIAAALADPRALFLAAAAGPELVGDLGLLPEAHACSGHVAVLGMSVAREWRGLGVGGELLEVAAEWAAAGGVTKLTLGVFPENLRAVRFYERHGFVREGLRCAQYDRAGRYHDEMLMARFLTTTA